VFGRKADLFQTVLCACIVTNLCGGNCGHTNDGVHGSAVFVRHAGKKIPFRGVGLLGAF